jgi:hypothetical protein
MSANGIAHLPTKQARQAAKLALAATNRQAFSANASVAVADNRYTLDTTELPTVYSGNTVVSQPHVGGLITGRPWK